MVKRLERWETGVQEGKEEEVLIGEERPAT